MGTVTIKQEEDASDKGCIIFRSTLEQGLEVVEPYRQAVVSHVAGRGTVLEPLIDWVEQKLWAEDCLFTTYCRVDSQRCKRKRKHKQKELCAQDVTVDDCKRICYSIASRRRQECGDVLKVAREYAVEQAAKGARNERQLVEARKQNERLRAQWRTCQQRLNNRIESGKRLRAEKGEKMLQPEKVLERISDIRGELEKARVELFEERAQRGLEIRRLETSNEELVQMTENFAEERARAIELAGEKTALVAELARQDALHAEELQQL